MFEIFILSEPETNRLDWWVSTFIPFLALLGAIVGNLISFYALHQSRLNTQRAAELSFDLDWFKDEVGSPVREQSVRCIDMIESFTESINNRTVNTKAVEEFVDDVFIPCVHQLKLKMRGGVTAGYIHKEEYERVFILNAHEDKLIELLADADAAKPSEWGGYIDKLDEQIRCMIYDVRKVMIRVRRDIVRGAK